MSALAEYEKAVFLVVNGVCKNVQITKLKEWEYPVLSVELMTLPQTHAMLQDAVHRIRVVMCVMLGLTTMLLLQMLLLQFSWTCSCAVRRAADDDDDASVAVQRQDELPDKQGSGGDANKATPLLAS